MGLEEEYQPCNLFGTIPKCSTFSLPHREANLPRSTWIITQRCSPPECYSSIAVMRKAAAREKMTKIAGRGWGKTRVKYENRPLHYPHKLYVGHEKLRKKWQMGVTFAPRFIPLYVRFPGVGGECEP